MDAEQLRAIEAVPLLDALAKNFDKLTKEFEKDFVCGLVAIIASGKCSHLSSSQASALLGIYASVIWRPLLPEAYQKARSRRPAPKAGEG